MEKTNFSEKQYLILPAFPGSYLFRVANFSKDLTFHGHYFFRRASFLQDNFSEEQVRFLSTAIFPIYKLEIKWLDTS